MPGDPLLKLRDIKGLAKNSTGWQAGGLCVDLVVLVASMKEQVRKYNLFQIGTVNCRKEH